jgi:uncharacterized protein YgbK (DUF1537 family)
MQHGNLTVDADVLIVDTETRNESSAAAYHITHEMTQSIRAYTPEVVVKKIDSLLRGSIWAEIEAVGEVYGFDRCLLVVASPKLNRTTVKGYHYVDGELLEVARQRVDPSSSVIGSYIPATLGAPLAQLLDIDVIRQGVRAIQVRIQESEGFLLIADCTDQHELNIVVAVAYEVGIRFFAGTYGLGEALCRLRFESAKPVLVVVGSLSSAAHQQADYLARRSDCVHIQLRYDASFFDMPVAEQARQYETEMRMSLNGVSCVIFQVSVLPDEAQQLWNWAVTHGLDTAAVSDRIDALMRAILEPFLSLYGGFVATGGSTANSLFQLLKADGLRLDAIEVLPGTPGARLVGGDYDGLPFIVKPGSQGDDDALARMVDYVYLVAANAQ